MSYGAPQRERPAVSTLVNRNVTVNGRRTSVRLEPAMWDALREIAARERRTLHDIVTEIDGRREASSLTAAIRVYIVVYWRERACQAEA
jgi:predicted DNA-binding ribbon-helix-helix protein